MKRFLRVFALCLGLCAAAGLFACAHAQEEACAPAEAALTALVPAKKGMAEIKAVAMDGETLLFLPAFADLQQMSLVCDGVDAPWKQTAETEEGDVLITVQAEGMDPLDVTVM